MKKRIAALALSGALLLSGCGSSDPGAETQPRQTEPVSTVTSTETTQTTLPFPTETVSELAGDALSLLRADMKPHMAALGYFGYFDEEIFDTPMDYLRDVFPNYLASNAYLSGIDRVYGNYGTLYCVVPKDPNARVTINHVKFEGEYPYEYLRTIEADAPGEPFFVLCIVDEETLLEVIITESDGRTLRWYPTLSELYCKGTRLTSSYLVADYGSYEDLPKADPANANKALDTLRADMTVPVAARVMLDQWDERSGKAPIEYAREIYPKFFAENEFLADVEVCYGGSGSIYCVVPRLPDTAVTVNVVSTEGEYPYQKLESLGEHTDGEPFFVLSDLDETKMLEVMFTEPDGRTLFWYPYWNEVHGDTEVVAPESLMTGFPAPSERSFRDTLISYGWVVPELSQINGTCWQSRYYSYGLDLFSGGEAILYDISYDEDFNSIYSVDYRGVWLFDNGYLTLTMRPEEGTGHEAFTGTYPLLLASYGELWLGRSEADGTALPYIPAGFEGDDLQPTVG